MMNAKIKQAAQSGEKKKKISNGTIVARPAWRGAILEGRDLKNKKKKPEPVLVTGELGGKGPFNGGQGNGNGVKLFGKNKKSEPPTRGRKG